MMHACQGATGTARHEHYPLDLVTRQVFVITLPRTEHVRGRVSRRAIVTTYNGLARDATVAENRRTVLETRL